MEVKTCYLKLVHIVNIDNVCIVRLRGLHRTNPKTHHLIISRICSSLYTQSLFPTHHTAIPQIVMPSFLELPSEIRNMMYSLLLVGSNPIDLGQRRLTSSSKHPTILSTARAIYNEAMPILYGQNHFIIHDSFQLEFITYTGWRMVRHISFYIPLPRQAWEGTEEGSWLHYLDFLDTPPRASFLAAYSRSPCRHCQEDQAGLGEKQQSQGGVCVWTSSIC